MVQCVKQKKLAHLFELKQHEHSIYLMFCHFAVLNLSLLLFCFPDHGWEQQG